MVNLSLTRVESAADQRRFYSLPWQVYQGDPCWAPHLWPQRKEYLDKRAAFFTYGEGDFWLAWLDGRVVGTIGTAINHAFNREKGLKAAIFGFFEVLPPGASPGYGDEEAWQTARALWDHACAWARQRGMTELRGPYSFNFNDEQGFLVEGFETPPAILMGHSHPLYPEWAQRYGFALLQISLAYRFDLAQIGFDVNRGPEIIHRIAERAQERHGAHAICHLELRDWDQEIVRLHQVYNRSLSVLPEFPPIELAEFRAQAESLKPVLDPDLILIAEVGGHTAGFALGLPNLAEALLHANGLRRPWDYLRLALARRKITSASFKILAVDPAYWGYGLEAAMFLEMGKAVIRKCYTWVDLSLTNELNPQTNKLARRVGAKVYRRYHEYRLEL